MTQRTLRAEPDPIHVALIMDGNGRWATRRRLPRSAGHRAGTDTVRRIVDAAPALGIGTLTLYAFSSDNWRRPARETAFLMRLFREHLRREAERCREAGVRLSVIGRRDRLDLRLRHEIEEAERACAAGTTLHLRLAIDYSAREAIVRAAAALAAGGTPAAPAPGEAERDAFACMVDRACHGDGTTPPVDLLLRTGGERRLSDFLLWEIAYAELFFTPVLWPDFTPGELAAAVADFGTRERRFGGLPRAVETA